MQNEQSVAVVKRWIDVFNEFLELDVFFGKKSFTDEYEINRWNFIELLKEPWRDIFQLHWLTIFVTDFGVSADWLITGVGDRYNPQMRKLIDELKSQTKEERKKNEKLKMISLPRKPIGRPVKNKVDK